MSQILQQLEQQFASEEDTAEKCDLLFKIIRHLYQLDTPAALERARQAYTLAESIHNSEQMMLALHWLSSCYIACSDYSGALSVLERAHMLPDSPGTGEYRAKTEYYLGMVHDRLGNKTVALEMFREALESARAHHNIPSTAAALNAIGNIMAASSRFDKALEAYFEVLRIREELGELNKLSMVCTNIAQVYAGMYSSDQAIVYFSRALEIAGKTGSRVARALPLLGLGDVYKDCRQYEQAFGCLREAQELFTALGDRDGVAQVFNSLGNLHESLSEPDNALDCYRQAL